MNRLSQIEALANSKGVKYLLDAAREVFNNPIVMFDTNYNLIAYTELFPDDPLWKELTETGTFSLKTQEFFAQEYFTEDAANASKMVILKSKKLKYDRMLGNIINGDRIKVANIIMCESTPFEEEDTEAFVKLADKISSEIVDDEFYLKYGRDYHEDKINKLLDKIIHDPLIYTAHVQILYDGFDDYLYVAVVDVSRNSVHENKLQYFKSLLESMYRMFKFSIYHDRIVMVMSSKLKKFDKRLYFGTHNNFLEQNNLYIGISGSFESLYELRENYDQAVIALEKGIGDGNGQRVVTINDI